MPIINFLGEHPEWAEQAQRREQAYFARDTDERSGAFVLLQPENQPVPEAWFWLWLSRVPCIGEEIHADGELFKVTRVIHFSALELNETAGEDAHVWIELQDS